MKAVPALALAASLAAVSLQAQAVTLDWGPHEVAEAAVKIVAPGMLVDSFEFSVGSGTTLAATAVANNLMPLASLPPVFKLDSGMVQLFRAQAGPDTLLGMFGFDGTTGNVAHTFASLAAGNYYYLVTGLAGGSAGGVYALTSTISAVPEPAGIALFLTGLLATGIALRKRRPV